MANKTSVQISIQDDPEIDDCRQNIAPGGTAAADTSTPAPKSSSGEVKEKSRVFNPILKHFPEPLKDKSSAHLNSQFFPFNFTTGNCRESATSSSQPHNSGFSCRHLGHPSVSWLDDQYLPKINFFDTPMTGSPPEQWLDARYFPEITLLDLTNDSELSPREDISSMGITQDVSPRDGLKGKMPSFELTTEKPEKSDRSPANVTHDISSSTDTSAVSQFSTSDMQCNTSSKMVSSELHSEHVETPNNVDAKNELLNSDDAQKTNKVLQPSPKTTESAISTFTVAQPSTLSISTTQVPTSLNETMDRAAGNVSSPKADIDVRDQASSVSGKTTEISLVRHQNGSADEASGLCDVQNATFDKYSLQVSRESTSLDEASAASLCLQNNTFDKPATKQNGTITLSERSASDGHHDTMDNPDTLDKPTSSKVCNSATGPKDNNSGVLTSDSEHNSIAATADCNNKMGMTLEITSDVNPDVEAASEPKQDETKDHSQLNLPMTDRLSDSVAHQSVDARSSKANSFNLDDTLDFHVENLPTSTPMLTNCNIFSLSIDREEGKVLGVQKKLYGDGPGKPAVQVTSAAPSNIVSDQKTSLKQPTVKSRLPPLKPASQLLKPKPASILPRKFEPLTSGPAMTQQRTQTKAATKTAVHDTAQRNMEISSAYNLRASTTGSKHPTSGLPRPQLTSGIQKAAPGLRPPTTRSNTAASSTDKLHGSTATKPLGQKHQLPRGDALPSAKKKKIGCAKCVALQQQLAQQSQEIRLLKEELLKYRTHEDK